MTTRQMFTIPFLISALLALPACEKTAPTSTKTDPAGAADKVTQANQLLVPQIALMTQSNVDPSTLNFAASRALYLEALSLDPNNADAHFGAALTDILILTADPDLQNLFRGDILPLPPQFLQSLVAPGTQKPRMLVSLDAQTQELVLGGFASRMSSSLGKKSSVQAGPLPSYYQNIVETSLLPSLASAIAHLTFILQNPNYVFLVTPQMSGQTETYRIDATEFYLFRAVLQLIAGAGSGLVTYNVDYNSEDMTAVGQAWQSGSAFLALRSNGAERMKDTRIYLLGAAQSIQSGINFLMNEPPHTEIDLIVYNPADASTFQGALDETAMLVSALSGQYAIPNGPTVSLQNFFDDPIADYKAMVPPYTVSVQPSATAGRYDAILTWTATSFNEWIFPDPTMKGLFPGMSDAGLKALMQIDAGSWTQSVTIPGS